MYLYSKYIDLYISSVCFVPILVYVYELIPMVINVNNETENIVIPDSTRYSSASSADGYANIRKYRARSFHAATPTASSEASWNSQQGLLSHPAGAISVNIKNPSNPNPNNNNKHKSSISKPKLKEQIRNLNTLHSNPFPVQLYHKHKNCILIRSNPLQQCLRV